MKKHIHKATDTFMDDITRNAASPAISYLFKKREAAKLRDEKSENLHSLVAPLFLFQGDAGYTYKRQWLSYTQELRNQKRMTGKS